MKAGRLQTLMPAAMIGALLAIALPGAVAPASAQGAESPPTRSIRIATKEVTDPDVAVSPDGSWLVFTALGHLFRLPATGGAAEQLTSAPYYDAAPAISPDGTRVAFISDRKVSSQGNVFVLDLAKRQIRQVTDEAWVDRPVWSPDGKSIAFLSYQPVGPLGNYWFVGNMQNGWSSRCTTFSTVLLSKHTKRILERCRVQGARGPVRAVPPTTQLQHAVHWRQGGLKADMLRGAMPPPNGTEVRIQLGPPNSPE